jgi:hypothetical protein
MIDINPNGDIRWVGTSDKTYTTIEFHRNLMKWSEENAHLPIPSDRLTDEYIEINYPYNIDNEMANRITNGSIYDATTNIIWQHRIGLTWQKYENEDKGDC